MSRTPCVARPIIRRSEIFTRIVTPDLLIIIKSFSSVTLLIATNLPVFSVMFNVFTPFPPLRVIRYIGSPSSSLSFVLLPNPCSETTKMVSSESGSIQIMPITQSWSSSSSLMPLTPVAIRPIGRTSVSENRMARPLRFAMIICWLPSVKRTDITLSSSRIVMAFTPFCLGLE